MQNFGIKNLCKYLVLVILTFFCVAICKKLLFTVIAMQDKLTSREQEILDMLLKGLTPKEIAFNLNIKYATVDFHRNNLYHKLDVQSIQELFVKYGKAEQANTAEQNNPQPPYDVTETEAADPAAAEYTAQAVAPSFAAKKKKYIPAIIIALAISILLNLYFIFSFISQKSAALNITGKSSSYASEEKPLIIPMKQHNPWGWIFLFHPPNFFDPKITEGEIYTLHYQFSSDVDLDFLYIILADDLGTVSEPYYMQLSKKAFISFGNVIANTEYAGNISLTAQKSASSADHYANIIEINTNNGAKSQPTIIFTKFELNIIKSVSN